MRKTTDPDAHADTQPDVDVLELVHALMHDYRSVQYRALRDGPHGITHMDGKTLAFFAAHPGSTQAELAQHSGRDKAQLARLIKPLCEEALLLRSADEADKRNIRLTVTPAGQAVLRSLRQQSRRLSARATAGLSEAETRQLRVLLQRLRANIAGD